MGGISLPLKNYSGLLVWSESDLRVLAFVLAASLLPRDQRVCPLKPRLQLKRGAGQHSI